MATHSAQNLQAPDWMMFLWRFHRITYALFFGVFMVSVLLFILKKDEFPLIVLGFGGIMILRVLVIAGFFYRDLRTVFRENWAEAAMEALYNTGFVFWGRNGGYVTYLQRREAALKDNYSRNQ